MRTRSYSLCSLFTLAALTLGQILPVSAAAEGQAPEPKKVELSIRPLIIETYFAAREAGDFSDAREMAWAMARDLKPQLAALPELKDNKVLKLDYPLVSSTILDSQLDNEPTRHSILLMLSLPKKMRDNRHLNTIAITVHFHNLEGHLYVERVSSYDISVLVSQDVGASNGKLFHFVKQ